MKIWKDAFEIWSNFCQFVKRDLISKDRFVDWAEKLRIIKSSERDHFYVYLKILEDGNALCPLTERIEESNINNQAEIKPLYHPIQFFDVLRWFKNRSYNTRPYFNKSDECNDYFSIHLLKRVINQREKQIEISERLGINIPDQQKYLESLKTEFQNKSKKEFPKGDKLIALLSHSILEPLFNESRLILWIKLESLCLQENARFYSPISIDMHLRVNNQEEERESMVCRKRYLSWFNNIIKIPSESFSEDDYKILKSFHFRLSQRLRESDFREAHWDDLFDLISARKKDSLFGYTSLYVNLLSIKRYLERACWLLFKKNIVFIKELDKIPYFYCIDYEHNQLYDKQYLFYTNNTVLDFGLYPMIPFILYVEGASDYVIMEDFLKKTQGLKFRIKIMHSADKAIHIEKFHDPIEDQHCYFFDFDSKKKYKEKKRKYSGKSSFFFPDFITENFAVKEVLRALKLWICKFNITIENSRLERITSDLEEEKHISEKLLDEIETYGEILKPITSKGYEKIIINFLKQNYSRILSNFLQDEIKFNSNGHIQKEEKNLKKFADKVKTEISNRLKLIVAKRMEDDPDRKFSKFSFEEKLSPLYEKINKLFMHRVKNIIQSK